MRASRTPLALLLCASLFVTACDLPRAWGDANALVVAADEEFWAMAEGNFLDALEPTIQAVRNERPYRIQYQDPTQSEWGNLRRFRQVVAIGTPTDPWVIEALRKVPTEERGDGPGIIQARDVWAQGQLVSILIVPEGADRLSELGRKAEELRTLLDDQFRDYAISRMFVSGAHEALADSLEIHVGFTLRLPSVYRYAVQDSVFLFRNDNPSPSELIREIVVSWDSPIPDSPPSRPEIEARRISMTERYYAYPQALDTTVVSFGEIETNGLDGVEYQAAWINPPGEWPAGGPFITRALACPSQNRLYYVDAWLYAPDQDKYEYMIQLQTILDSFACR